MKQALEGKRIRLINCNDPHTTLKPGDTGTVAFVDDMYTVHVDWDNGSKLGLCPADGDSYAIIQPEDNRRTYRAVNAEGKTIETIKAASEGEAHMIFDQDLDDEAHEEWTMGGQTIHIDIRIG